MPKRYQEGAGAPGAESPATDAAAVPSVDPTESPNGIFRFSLDVDGEQFAVSQSGPGSWGYVWLTGPNEGYGFGASGPPTSTPEEHRERIRGFLRDIDPATGFIGGD